MFKAVLLEVDAGDNSVDSCESVAFFSPEELEFCDRIDSVLELFELVVELGFVVVISVQDFLDQRFVSP